MVLVIAGDPGKISPCRRTGCHTADCRGYVSARLDIAGLWRTRRHQHPVKRIERAAAGPRLLDQKLWALYGVLASPASLTKKIWRRFLSVTGDQRRGQQEGYWFFLYAGTPGVSNAL